MTEQRTFDLNGIKVFIAIPCYTGVVPIEQAIALSRTVLTAQASGVTIDFASERECGLITEVREKLVWRFLNESTADYLFWIDDDILFQPSDFMTILALATEKKISAATYPSRSEKLIFFLQYLNGETPEFDEYGMIKVKGCGLGFTCIHRDVIKELVATRDFYYDELDREIPDLFRVGKKNRKPFGEDIEFLNSLYEMGYITYVLPTITLKHVGRKDYYADLIFKEKENAGSS